jgi:hypothetical protein
MYKRVYVCKYTSDPVVVVFHPGLVTGTFIACAGYV